MYDDLWYCIMESLSDTSAFVLLLSGNSYCAKYAKKYQKLLDLNSGKEMALQVKRIWPHYNTVIKNRKKCILDLALYNIKQNITQVVIFGAGMDALSLELLSRAQLDIYEIDASNMKLKNKLIKDVNSKFSNNIHCLDFNLKDHKEITNLLEKHGWDKTRPSMLIFEGISYYLKENNLFSIIKLFKTKNLQNRIILEYLLPQNQINQKRRDIPKKVFQIIKQRHSLNITTFDRKKIQDNLDKIKTGKILKTYSLKDMEKMRTKNNIYFPTKSSGWIQVSSIAI